VGPQPREVELVNQDPAQPPAETIPAPRGKPIEDGLSGRTYPIDLPTALRLADADNLQVAFAREQVQQAYSEYRLANTLWLPSIRGGANYNHHDGPLLSSAGEIRDISRSFLYFGNGAAAGSTSSPAFPGIFASFKFADALFQPLAAQQRWGARESAATATRNNMLLDVALAYLELLRSAQDVAITQDIRDRVAELSRLTAAFAKTGQGLQADAERMQVELGLRENDIRRSIESLDLASTRLTQLLRMEPCVRLDPIEPAVVRLCLVPPNCDCPELVAQALENRPELAQSRYLVGEAVQRLRRERYAPFLPSVLLGASYGGFGGGLGGTLANFNGRLDFDAIAYWEVRGLGFGESAVRDAAGSIVRQAQIQELATLDLVAREVASAQAQVQIRGRQIDTARDVVQVALASYEHNLVRIQQAEGLPIEALQSAQALLSARREYLRAVTDYNAGQFTLQRALGWPVGQPELSNQP